MPDELTAAPAASAARRSAGKTEAPAQPTWVKLNGYRAVRFACRMASVVGLQLRCRGRTQLPPTGGALICSNHQSFLDPVLIGCAFDRRINYLARETLFRFPLGPLLRFLDTIPLDRDGLGLSGLKETLKRLRRGEAVLVFPEGTRCEAGEMGPLQPGICSLARRGRAPILPVGVDGAFDAWPRQHLLPRPAIVEVCVGQPIPVEQWQQMDDNQLLEALETSIKQCQLKAREMRRR